MGRAWKTAARTIGESDVNAFSALTGDYTYLHTDAEAAAKTPFGERVGHGLLGLSFLMGLVTRLGIVEGTVEAFLGVEWRFPRPDSLRRYDFRRSRREIEAHLQQGPGDCDARPYAPEPAR